jgi:hypothetical protein
MAASTQTIAYVSPSPCPLLAHPGGICGRTNRRHRNSGQAFVDDADFTTMVIGQWGSQTRRVVCDGCGGFVRWGTRERTPEEVAAAKETGREYRRAHYEKMGWKVKYADRRLPDDVPPEEVDQPQAAVTGAQYAAFQDIVHAKRRYPRVISQTTAPAAIKPKRISPSEDGRLWSERASNARVLATKAREEEALALAKAKAREAAKALRTGQH